MRFSTFLLWGLALWIGAGVEYATGCGIPGPLMMIAIAAGFSAGPQTGGIVGAAAGLCDAALGHSHLFLFLILGALMGLGASVFARFVSRHNIFMAVVVALIFAICFSSIQLLIFRLPLQHALLPALWQSLLNSLWMIPIYGIVILVSPLRGAFRHSWE